MVADKCWVDAVHLDEITHKLEGKVLNHSHQSHPYLVQHARGSSRRRTFHVVLHQQLIQELDKL